MSEKSKCVLAYIFGWIGGLVVLFAINNNQKNTKLHAAQSIVMSVAYWLLITAYRFIPISIPFFSQILWIGYIVIIVIGIIKANKEENPEIPVIADIAKSIFGKKIGE